LRGAPVGSQPRRPASAGRHFPKFPASGLRLPQRTAEPPSVPYKTVSLIGFNFTYSIRRAKRRTKPSERCKWAFQFMLQRKRFNCSRGPHPSRIKKCIKLGRAFFPM